MVMDEITQHAANSSHWRSRSTMPYISSSKCFSLQSTVANGLFSIMFASTEGFRLIFIFCFFFHTLSFRSEHNAL